MFGVLSGASCQLKPAERQAWTGHLCGQCLALRDNCGQTARIATNYDAALLSALCEAQDPQPQVKYLSHCPLRRNFKAEVTAPNTPGAQYAASIALVMASTKIRDHLADGETFWQRIPGLAAHITRKWMRVARKVAWKHGFEVGDLVTQTSRQTRLEAQSGRNFFYYSQPTEFAVATAFQHTALIAYRPQNADILYEMGRMFGRITYLLDSYKDYAADMAADKFNPLISSFSDAQRAPQARRIFHLANRALKRHFDKLDLPQPALVRKLLLHQLRHKGQKILAIPIESNYHGLRPGMTTDAGSLSNRFVEDQFPEEDLTGPEQSRQSDSGCYGCRDCGGGEYCCGCEDCGCGDCGCGDCGCGDCDCGGCDCGDCDCGGCDGGGCDGGGCN